MVTVENQNFCKINFYGPNSNFVKLISKDLHIFIIRREHAMISGTFNNWLSLPIPEHQVNEIYLRQIPSYVLKKVCLFLAYKARYLNDPLSPPMMFRIEPDIAFEVLMAAAFLDC